MGTMKNFFVSVVFNNLPLKALSAALAVLFWLMARGYFGK
jgi:hypothetical protein